MTPDDRINVLLVDDQPAKLLSYEVILRELGENLIKTASAREAFECLLGTSKNTAGQTRANQIPFLWRQGLKAGVGDGAEKLL